MLTHLKNFIKQRSGLAAILATSIMLSTGYATYRWHVARTGALEQLPTTVTGSLITLKTLDDRDYVPLHHMFSCAVRKGLDMPEVITFADTLTYLHQLQQRAEHSNGLLYVIINNNDQKPIGIIELREFSPTDSGQLSCWINEAYWGEGRMREALRLASNTYFRHYTNQESYVAHVRLAHQHCYKAFKKAGLVDVSYFYEDGKPTRYIMEMRRG